MPFPASRDPILMHGFHSEHRNQDGASCACHPGQRPEHASQPPPPHARCQQRTQTEGKKQTLPIADVKKKRRRKNQKEPCRPLRDGQGIIHDDQSLQKNGRDYGGNTRNNKCANKIIPSEMTKKPHRPGKQWIEPRFQRVCRAVTKLGQSLVMQRIPTVPYFEPRARAREPLVLKNLVTFRSEY